MSKKFLAWILFFMKYSLLLWRCLNVQKMKFNRIFFVLVAVFCLTFSHNAYSQRVSVSTNLVDWANLGTINAEASLAFSRHFSVTVGGRYNNWSFRPGEADARLDDPEGQLERQFQNRKMAFNLGMRWWPWYINSGWWVAWKGQYMMYNRGGVFNHTSEEGDSAGLSIGAGYSLMLTKYMNIEFGAAGWGGWKWYKTYQCTKCGQILEEGNKFFFLPDNVFVSLVFVF